MALTLTGTSGKLKQGFRQVAVLGAWKASSAPGNPDNYHLHVSAFTADPIWWERRGSNPLKIEFPWGRRTAYGTAVVVMESPLILEVGSIELL